MMKKLLTLSLVLGLAAMANAVPTLVISGSDTIDYTAGGLATVVITSDDVNPYQAWLTIESGPGAAAGAMVILPNAGSSASVDTGYAGWWGAEALSLSTTEADWVKAGDHFTLDIIGSAEGEIVLGLYEGDGVTPINSVTIHSVPEPLTMGLLGLGGLFLRRRK
jgi:hypothetical protein